MEMALGIILKNMDKLKIGIIGYGEVGRALAKFYKNPRIKNLDRDDGLVGIDILHICLPSVKNFVSIVKKEIKRIRPKLTIIHSTIPPGTTKKIISGLPKNLQMVVHSPVRGIHPHLHQGIKTFLKYIGAENKKAAKLAEKHFKSLGIKTKIFYPSATTELGKLLDTTYYGLCIAWHSEMEKICDKLGVDFENTVTDFNKTYNQGYKKLGMAHVIRPVLYPPKGGIGGHCIIPNAKILRKYFKSLAIDLILGYKSKKK